MAEEANVKLRLKVETREITKLKTELSQFKKGIESGNITQKQTGTGEAVKKAKKETEELSNTQKFAAETTKILSEEQSQLVTSVDSAEIAQKALGAALQSYVGISAAAIGVTLAVGSVAYSLIDSINQGNIALRERGRELALVGMSEQAYQALLKQGANLEAIRATRLASLEQGFVLTTEQIRMTQSAIIMFSNVLGGSENAANSMHQALAGSTDAMRNFGFSASEGSTKEQAYRQFLQHIGTLEAADQAARVRIRSDVNARSLSTDSERYKQIIIDGEYREYTRNQDRILQESIRAAQERNRVRADLEIQFQETQRQREARQAEQTAREAAQAAMGNTMRLQDLSGVQLGRNLTEAWAYVAQVNATVATTDEQRIARANVLTAANQRVQAVNDEINRRAFTTDGIRERMRREAINTAIGQGKTTQQIERIQIANSQIRARLEKEIADQRARLIGLSGKDAEKTREVIAGMIGQLQGLNAAGAGVVVSIKEIKSAFEDLRNTLTANDAALSAQSIFRGALSPANMALELGRIRQLRDESNRVLQEKLDAQAQILARYDAARTNAERVRLNTQLQRSQQEVGIARGHVQAYDQAFQTVSQAATNFNSETNRGLLGAQTQLDNDLYQDRLRRIAGSQRDSANTMQGFRDQYQAWLATLTGDANQFQLEMARGFNPSSMIDAINQGVNYARETVTVEEQRLAQLESSGASREEIIAQEERVTSAKQNLAGATRDAASAQRELAKAQQDASFGGQFLKSITANTKGLQGLGSYAGGMVTKGLNMMSDAAWAALDAMKSGEEVLPAIAAVLSETLKSIGQEAGIKALMETAAGIAATFTPALQETAAGHFAAAGVYATVAVAAGAGYMALPTPPDKKKKEDNDVERDLLNMKSRIPNVNINGAVFATKEEVGKAITEAYSTYNSKW